MEELAFLWQADATWFAAVASGPRASAWHPVRRGLFAFDGARLLPLHGRPDSLEALLRAEARSLQGLDPSQLATFFAEALGRRGRLDHAVISDEKLEQMEASGDYVLARPERGRIAALLEPAAITRLADGWTLRFATLFGWNAERHRVASWCIHVRGDFSLDVRVESISDRIFAVTPISME